MEYIGTQPMHRKLIAIAMAFIMAFTLMPLPGHADAAYAHNELAAGTIVTQEAGSGKVIYKIDADATAPETYTISEGTTTVLELGGHTLTQNFVNNGTLVIEGASDKVVGTITNSGTLTISAGTVKGTIANTGTGTVSFSGATLDGDVSNSGTGSVTIASGTVTGKASATAGTVSISGGSFTGTNPVASSGGTVNITGGSFTHGENVAAPSGSGVLYPKGKALVKGTGESAYTLKPSLAAFKVEFTPDKVVIEPGTKAPKPSVQITAFEGITMGAVDLGSEDAVVTFNDASEFPDATPKGEYEVKATGAAGSAFAGTSQTAAAKYKVEHGVVVYTNVPTSGTATTEVLTSFLAALEKAKAASGSSTLKLIDDVSLVTEGKTVDDKIFVTGTIKLDLNGHTLTSLNNVLRPEGANTEFTVCDSSGGAKGVLQATKAVIRADENAKVIIGNGATVRTTDRTVDDYAIAVFNGCTATVEEGATIDAGGFAISGNGQTDQQASTYGNGSHIVVNGGTLKSEHACAIYAPSYQGDVTVNGGTITGATGIELRAGTLKVTGGSITGTATTFKSVANGNGSTTDGPGIAVVQHSTNDTIKVEISGSPVIKGYHALYQGELNGNEGSKITIAISGGTFIGASGQDAVKLQSVGLDPVARNITNTKIISGGLFSSDPRRANCGLSTTTPTDLVASTSAYLGYWTGYHAIGTKTVKKPAENALKSFTYDGQTHTAIELGGYEGYVIVRDESTVSAKDQGTYKVKFRLADGCQWEDTPSNSADIERTWTISKKSLADQDVAFDVRNPKLTYNGEAQGNAVQVIAGSTLLKQGDEYTLTYYSGTTELSGPPTAAGTYGVVATGQGNYTGNTAKVEYEIGKAPIEKPTDLVTVEGNLTYNGSAQTGVMLKDTASWATLSGASATDAGEHAATVTLDGNHAWADGSTGAKTVSWSIAKASIATVQLASSSAKHTGSNVAPAVTVKDSNGNTVASSHYKVTFTRQGTTTGSAQAIEEGTYDVAVEATDNNYLVATTAKATFIVTSGDSGSSGGGGSGDGKDTTSKAIDQPVAAALTYTGSSQIVVPAGEGYTLSVPSSSASNVTIESGTGHAKVTNAGTGSVTATLKSGYTWKDKTGSASTSPATINFSVAKRTVSAPAGANLTYTGLSQVVVSAGTGYSLSVPSTNGGGAVIDRVTGNAVATNVGSGAVNVTLSDATNYQWSGSANSSVIQVTWAIREASPQPGVTGDVNVSLSRLSFTYTGSRITPGVTVTDSTGKALVQGSDYTLTYGANVNAGTGHVYVSYSSGGQGRQVDKTFTIARAPITSVSGVSASKVYTGKALKPKPTVTASTGTLASGTDYSLKYANNTKVGTATVTVTGEGNYTGTFTRTFNIVPQSTGITKTTRAKKGFTVQWAKQATQTSGYQVQYSQTKSFKGASVTTTVNKNTTLSKAVKVTKSKAKYYVHVRAYKTVSGERYYSAWSSTKSVKTK